MTAATILGQGSVAAKQCSTCGRVIVPASALPNTFDYCRCAQSATTNTAAVPTLHPFMELALGARFSYQGHSDVYVLLERHGEGLVAQHVPSGVSGPLQGIYSAFESRDECLAAKVLVYSDTATAQPAAAPLSGWISVDERLPAKGEHVIAYRPTAKLTQDDEIRILRYKACETESWQGVVHGFEGICHPTHWMPLPTAPGTEAAPVEQDAVREQLVALQAKCDLLSASLKQADAVRDGLVVALKACLTYGSMTGAEWVNEKARAALAAAGELP